MTINEEAKKYYHLGVECYNNNDFEGAINNFTKAIKIDSNFKEAYLKRGLVYIKFKRYEKALKDCTKAIEIDSKDEISYYCRGVVYTLLERYKEALQDCNDSINLYENFKEAYLVRGVIYSKLKRYEEAIKDYNRAIDLNIKYKEVYSNLGITYIKRKSLIEAKESFKKYLEIKKQEDEQNNNLKATDNNITEINIEDDILSILESILVDILIDDNEKIILIELIYYCYHLKQKIKVNDETFKLTHYTKAGNLKFLLKKNVDFGKLRLNNTIYMNDPEEGQVLKRLLSKYKDNRESNIFQYDSDINNYTYLTCFCPYEKRDELPMWVHYGDSGNGVGLVFNEKFFENQDLYNVQYIDTENFDIDNVDENIREELKKIFNFLSEDSFTKSENKQFLEYTNIIINDISYLFKDKAYEYESEARMVQFRDYESEDICINEDLEVPRLYIEYKKEIKAKDYCEEIIVGPKGNFEEVATYGKYIGVKQCTKSKIKYR